MAEVRHCGDKLQLVNDKRWLNFLTQKHRKTFRGDARTSGGRRASDRTDIFKVFPAPHLGENREASLKTLFRISLFFYLSELELCLLFFSSLGQLAKRKTNQKFSDKSSSLSLIKTKLLISGSPPHRIHRKVYLWLFPSPPWSIINEMKINSENFVKERQGKKLIALPWLALFPPPPLFS